MGEENKREEKDSRKQPVSKERKRGSKKKEDKDSRKRKLRGKKEERQEKKRCNKQRTKNDRWNAGWNVRRFYRGNLDTIRGEGRRSVNLVGAGGKLTFPVATVQSEVVRALLPVDKLTEPPGEVTSFFPAVVRPVGKVNLWAPLNSLGHGIRHQTLCNQNKKGVAIGVSRVLPMYRQEDVSDISSSLYKSW